MSHSDFILLLNKYLFGFATALVLSILSYVIVTAEWLPTATGTMAVLLLLASVQLVIQLVCFLHLGFAGRSRNRTLTITFTLIMMLIIIIGSLWVMRNLDYRMSRSAEDMNHYMQQQNKKGF
jgi:cytochrome o ubiquinol oxidase operon protein cyoD